MNGSLVQIIKSSLVSCFSELMDKDSILLGSSEGISRKYWALLQRLVKKKEAVFVNMMSYWSLDIF